MIKRARGRGEKEGAMRPEVVRTLPSPPQQVAALGPHLTAPRKQLGCLSEE